jgi:hypothetical protein
MSEFTFNIADYRPLSAVRAHLAHDTRPILRESRGFVVFTQNSEAGEYGARWQDSRPAIVDIRSVRQTHGTRLPSPHATSHTRCGKILRFATSDAHDRVYTMTAKVSDSQPDDNPGPEAA